MAGGIVGAYLSSARDLVASVLRGRRLLAALARREVSDEYVEHSFAKGWPIVHPLVVMCVYLFVFTKIFPSRIAAPDAFATDSVVYLMAGIIPWLATSQILSRSLTSVVNNAIVVKQMAFPLEFLPIKTLAGPMLSTGIMLAFLTVYAVYLTDGACLPAYLVGIPVLAVLTVAFLGGLALLLASAQVFVRDLREFIGIFLAIGLFVHPILYFPDAIPDTVQGLIYLSPITYLLFCWQDVLFYGAVTRPEAWLVAAGFSLLALVVGARVFMVSKHHFGDFL
jgi:lipopolysaccharide transport system permease protein